mgnify:CR=1 FL=1
MATSFSVASSGATEHAENPSGATEHAMDNGPEQPLALPPPTWKVITEYEKFHFGFATSGRLGYFATVTLWNNQHANCGCFLSQRPLQKNFFLPHSEKYHGSFPMHHTQHANWAQELRLIMIEEFVSKGVWMIQPITEISYGCLTHKLTQNIGFVFA